jgi:hypothetical protein
VVPGGTGLPEPPKLVKVPVPTMFSETAGL